MAPPGTVRKILNSAGFYPITGLYIGGVVTALAISQGYLDLRSGVIVFALMAVAAMLYSANKELREMHILLEAQRIELTTRIDQLANALTDAGMVPPLPGVPRVLPLPKARTVDLAPPITEPETT